MGQLNERQLLDLKDQVEEAKTRVSELNGQKQVLMKQLKDEWNCESTEEGDKEISRMLVEIKALDEKIQEETKELQEKYNIE